ncbi:hypothetical protein Pan44_15480 [Caulifigura coniformis]|uniref:Transmembrane protein n=1 Tax=Caulifigura coniformis TaxID=2527983 RepID=A0A517SBQ8_9PLAN|nr:hypothetical protein [Caulifigura coniformis]QDT53526.1 hypothetical protein Pan44_15480 [Caulifigura coniformis]
MSDITTAEIRSRIANLQAELHTLSLQLVGPDVDEQPGPVASREALRAAVVSPKAPDAAPDHARSRRTLHDLMWQGRWSLAFHLARALEVQNVPGNEFHSSLIRAWTLASQADCQRDHEARQLIQVVLDEAEQHGRDALARQMFSWATIIVLLRSIAPSEVRAFANRFAVPQELPATSAWWNQYVETLAESPRPGARWIRRPERNAAAEELDHLMLAAPFEPVRLAASCLIMSIRCAMRHVQIVSRADERLVLNAELNRATRIRFTDNGTAAASASEIEQAVCDLAARAPGSRVWNIDETAGEPPAAELIEPSTDRADVPLNSADDAEAKAEPSDESALHKLKRAAARERLERYVQRLESRGNFVAGNAASDEVKPTASLDEVSSTPEPKSEDVPREPKLIAFVRQVESASSAATGAEPQQAAVKNTELPAGFDTDARAMRSDDRRGIHEAAVATAFGVEGGWAGSRPATVAGRPADAGSIWGAFFNAQAVIVAGLLIIAGAVVAGLGTGLTARTLGDADVRKEQPAREGSTADDVGDFQVAR